MPDVSAKYLYTSSCAVCTALSRSSIGRDSREANSAWKYEFASAQRSRDFGSFNPSFAIRVDDDDSRPGGVVWWVQVELGALVGWLSMVVDWSAGCQWL